MHSRAPIPSLPFLLSGLVVGVLSIAGAAEQASRRPAGPSAERLRLWETTVSTRLAPVAGNPFNPADTSLDAEIAAPSGRTLRLPLFYSQPHRRRREGKKEVAEAAGPPAWTLRFTPRESGAYRVRILYRTREAAPRVVRDFSLRVREARLAVPGFVEVNDANPRRFAFSEGGGYFALGHNVCWVTGEEGTYGYDYYLRRLAGAGENYTRVWLCTWGLGLQTRRPYAFDLRDAWRLDHVLREAERLGIYVKLCIDNFYDYVHHFERTPYAAENGGPCAEAKDFFTHPAARAMHRAKLRYLAARYGAFRSVLAWELWNEMNYVVPSGAWVRSDGRFGARTESRDREAVLVEWTAEAARALRGFDAHGHLVTTSLGNKIAWDALWSLPMMDIAQIHAYIGGDPQTYVPLADRDAAAFVLRHADWIRDHPKPALFAEFGFAELEKGRAPVNRLDPDGLALHNALWAGTLSGLAGTPMLWWWDTYIEPRNLYGHYRALSLFLDGVDWTEPMAPMRVEDDTIRVLALRGKRQHLLWVQNRRNTWYDVLWKKRSPERREGVRLHLTDFPPGTYRCRWVDPYTGKTRSRVTVKAPDGALRLGVPPFRRDVALRAERTPSRKE